MNKVIKLSCSCGASIEIVDHVGTYLQTGGGCDDNGRCFVIDKQADDWLDRHQKCIPSLQGRVVRDGTGQAIAVVLDKEGRVR